MSGGVPPSSRASSRRKRLPAGIEVRRAYTMRNGRDVPDGWDVFVNGEWGNRYPTKRAALDAVLQDNPRKRLRSKVARAADLFERFTGHKASVSERIPIEPIGPNDQIVAVLVGQLDGVLYTTVRDGVTEKYIHRFAQRDKPDLVVSHDGARIFVIGGRYRFTELGIVDASDKKHRNAR